MIIKIGDKKPQISKDAWIAENAAIIGDVEIGPGSSVWYSASLRADVNKIKIGKSTSIQDNTVIHLGHKHGVEIGDYTTIGHQAIIHGCTIGDNVVVGMGAVILDGAKIGENSLIGAGSLVTENKEIPPNTLAFGNPIRIIRELAPEEIESNKQNALDYAKRGQYFKNESEIIG